MPSAQIQLPDLDGSPRVDHEDAPCMVNHCCSACLRAHNERVRLLGEAFGFEQAAQAMQRRAAELWANSEEAAAERFRTFAHMINDDARVKRGEASKVHLAGCTNDS